MSRPRHRPRTSRVLLLILGLTVAIGVVAFVTRYRNDRALAALQQNQQPAVPAQPAAVTPARAPEPDPDAALVTQTPTKPAATRPTSPTTRKTSVATTRPTTRPRTAGTAADLTLSSKPLADAKAKVVAKQLLEARDIYNAALLSGKLSTDEERAAKEQMSELNETIVFSPRRFPNDVYAEAFTVPPGGVLAKIAKRLDVTPELLARVNNISDPRRLQAGQSIKVIQGPMHAVVDKSDFTIDVFFGAPGGEGSTYVTTFKVGLGKDDSTPTGTWLVEAGKKLTNPTYHSPPGRGHGVIEADDPANPLGEFWIGLSGVEGEALGQPSYGIHGTIEPESIGQMASMGCIRMLNEDVGRLFEMLVEGKSTVVVKE